MGSHSKKEIEKSPYNNIKIPFSDERYVITDIQKIWISKDVNFDNEIFLNELIESKDVNNIDKIYKGESIIHNENIDLILKLRCKLSHSIVSNIRKIYEKGKKYNLKWVEKDLLNMFLEDYGERSIRIEKQNIIDLTQKFLNLHLEKSKKKFIEIPFNYKTIENLAKLMRKKREKDSISYNLRLNPFSAEVIYTFDHLNISEISNWTKLKILGDRGLRQFARDYGKIFFMKPWSVINDTPTSTSIKAWELYGDGKDKKLIEKIILTYKNHYKESKSKFKNDKNRVKGSWDPHYDEFYKKIFNKEIIREIKPSLKNEEITEEIYKELIKILICIANSIYKYFGLSIRLDPTTMVKNDKENTSEEREIWDEKFNQIKNIQKIPELEPKEQFVINIIRNNIKAQIKMQLSKEEKTFDKFPERKTAWCLFSKIDLERIQTKKDIDKEMDNILEMINNIYGRNLTNIWLNKRFLFGPLLETGIVDAFKFIKACIVNDKVRKDYINKNEIPIIDSEVLEFLKKDLFLQQWTDDNDYEKNEFKFSDKKELNNIIAIIKSEWNPRKDRKYEMILIVRELLKEHNIVC